MRTRLSLSLLSTALLALMQPSSAFADTTAAHGGQVFPIRDAFIRYHRNKHSFSLTALNQAHQPMVLSWTDGPGATVNFEGKPALTFVSDYTSTNNGAVNYNAIDTEYFAPNSYLPLGTVVVIKGSKATVTRYSTVKALPLPTSARVGQSGSYGEISGYNDASKSQLLDRRVATWRLEPDPQNAGRALFCIDEIVHISATPDIKQTANECFHEDTAGNFSAPMEIDGTVTTFH